MNAAQRCPGCPGCGRPNGCAQAGREQPVADCWCFHAPIEPGLLDELPAELRNENCLCPACLNALAERAKPD